MEQATVKNVYIVIVALVLALCGSLYALSLSRETVASMGVQVSDLSNRLEAQQRLTADIQVQVQAETARANANRMELRNALKENREWAAGRTPAAVADSLCKPPARCSPAPSTVRGASN